MELELIQCRYCGGDTLAGSVYCCRCGERLARKRREKGEERTARRWAKPRIRKDGHAVGRIMIDGERVTVEGRDEADYYAQADAIAAGIIERRDPDRRTVAEALAAYIKEREGVRSPATIDGYLRKAAHNLQSIMQRRVGELSREDVQAAVAQDIAAGYGGKSIKEALALVGSATGKRWDDLVLPSAKPKKKPPVYSADDLRRLLAALAAIGGDVEAAGLLAVWLSLRRSEIVALRWRDIGDGVVTVRGARVYDQHHKLIDKGTKTSESERRIGCDGYILRKLRALPGEHKSEDYVISTSTSGLWDGITRACELAGVEHGYLHGLRHVNASIMELLGVPAAYANRRGGWASDHVRRGVYVEALPEGERDAADAIDAYLGGLLYGPPLPPGFRRRGA